MKAKTVASGRPLRQPRQGGFAVGAELLFLAACVLCLAVLAWGAVGAKVVAEWADLGAAVGSLDQGYSTSGMAVFHPNDPVHDGNNPVARWAGSAFADAPDFCDTPACDGGVVLCTVIGGESSGATAGPGDECDEEPCNGGGEN